MCGIAGIFGFNGKPVDPQVLGHMTDLHRHRGPDDQGFHLFSFAKKQSVPLEMSSPDSSNDQGLEGGFGFNRLSILDLSVNGHQPMCTQDGSIGIIFNGEIYNAFDLKPELEQAGFKFRSLSDTEVVLYLYQHLGLEKMLARLNGMFAMAIFDLNTGCMYLARDHFGIKPLYYYRSREEILFSSELKSFYAHPSFKPQLNSAVVDEYLMFRYSAGENTLLEGVNTLLPGHWMRITNDSCETRQYWNLPTGSCGQKESNSLDALEDEIRRSVKMQLLSDVRVGCQLSGGIDSSLVSVYASEAHKDMMDSFSIVFDDQSISEEPWIDIAAEKAGTNSFKFRLSPEDYFDNFNAATWHLDQPISHPNSLGIYQLAKEASQHITVFLSGEGADELFGGYTRFLYAALRPRLNGISPLLGCIPKIGARLKQRYTNTRHLDPGDWFILQSAFCSEQLLKSVKPGASLESAMEPRRSLFKNSGDDYAVDCMNYAMRTYLVNLLVRQDKMTMAHSMENRVPFLNPDLVRLVRSMPTDSLVGLSSLKSLRMSNTKIALKKLAEKYFDKTFVYRLKSGFPLPLREYFGDPRITPMMEDVVLPGLKERGLMDAGTVETWWRSLDNQNEATVHALWIVFAFELWANRFLSNDAAIN